MTQQLILSLRRHCVANEGQAASCKGANACHVDGTQRQKHLEPGHIVNFGQRGGQVLLARLLHVAHNLDHLVVQQHARGKTPYTRARPGMQQDIVQAAAAAMRRLQQARQQAERPGEHAQHGVCVACVCSVEGGCRPPLLLPQVQLSLQRTD